MAGEEWRTEADEEWLARHRSANFARMRRRLARMGLVGDAVSRAELGPFGGAPRDPTLRAPGAEYSTVRYAHRYIAYNVITVDIQRCRRCGGRLLEVYRLARVREDGVSDVLGTLRTCRRCNASSWMYQSRMPATRRGRRRDRKVVL